ncbi:MAG: hypothetical protein WCR98_02330, partial [Saccharofermentanales bacterium]
FEMYGMRYEDFLAYSGQTLAGVRQQMAPASRKNLVLAYTLDALEQEVKPEASDEEVDALIARFAEQAQISVEEYEEKYLDAEESRERLEHQVRSEKLVELLREWSVATDVEPEPEAEDEHEHVHDENCDHDHDHEHVHDENCNHDHDEEDVEA